MSADHFTRRAILSGATAGAFASSAALAQQQPLTTGTGTASASVEDYTSLVSDNVWTAAIQKGMDDLAAAGGGTLLLRRRGTRNAYQSGRLFFRPQVLIDGGGRGTHANEGMAWLRAPGLADDTYLFETDERSGGGFGLLGIWAQGDGAAGNSGGVRVAHNSVGVGIWHCSLSNWSRHAFVGQCGVSQFWHSGYGGWQNRALATGKVGVFQLSGADNMLGFNEIAGSSVRSVTHPTHLPISSGYFSDLYVSIVQGNIFECADEGVGHMGDGNRFIGNRYDTNAGHGLVARGIGNTSVGEFFGRNSFANGADNLYDHIHAPAGESGGHTFVAPSFYTSLRSDGTWTVPRHCINDQVVNAAYRNHYAWPGGVYAPTDMAGRKNYGTAFFNTPANGKDAAALTLKDEGEQRLEEGATPSVLLHKMFGTDAWTRPHNVTSFADGAPAQRILIRGNRDGHLILLAGEQLRLGSLPSPYVLRDTSMLEFINIGGPGANAVWQVIGR